MQIKGFAEKYQIQTDTIRYYEKEGLLKPNRRDNGYRDYDEDCEKQLQLIVVLKQMGFTIKEIQQLLILKGEPITPQCNSSTVILIEQKIVNIEEKIQFYEQASKLLKKVKELIKEEKYAENKDIIEELIFELFKSSDTRDIV